MSRISSKPRESHDLATHGTEAPLLLDVEQRHSAAATVVNGTRVVPYAMERHTVVEAYTKSSSRSWCLGMRHIVSGPDPRNECDHRTYKDLLRIAVSNGRLPHPSPAEGRPAFVRQFEGWPEGGRMVSTSYVSGEGCDATAECRSRFEATCQRSSVTRNRWWEGVHGRRLVAAARSSASRDGGSSQLG
ncbi:hypothetical protein CPLU01_03829 [Colletotrichum plurivorum]|uniref:Uncharacterized protein n=1 Tax=Colletotrichum plurivorum TaxID=2175906 RepID=A0A8H6KRV2_9PEZI|nr:hypothetical protein CPLU01_03829 [Colletotrichum plurivorum]